MRRVSTLRWDAHAVIYDLQTHFLIDFLIDCKPHDAAVCLGMTRYVSERLLGDAVDGHFYCCREVGKLLRYLH